jgi:single-strand DNA-binding protein
LRAGLPFKRERCRPACCHCKATAGSLHSASPFAAPPSFVHQNINPLHKEERMSTTAPNVNTVTLVGQLTSAPVLRAMSDGRNVCDPRLAVNDQRDQPPLFIDVATFGPEADACAEYLTKGRTVAVIGRVAYREWEKDGVKRSKHQVIGRVTFGGKPESDD